MYHQARNVGETEFIKALLKNGFIKAVQGTKIQDFNHIDVIGTYKTRIDYYFDVKDLSKKNLNSKNYSISEDLVNKVRNNKKQFKDHFIAFREYKNEIPSGKFNIFRTTTVVENVFKYGSNYYLFDVQFGLKNLKHTTFSV